MWGALEALFDSSSFMPHGHCYFWRPGVLWLNAGADLLIAAAYYSIPIALFVFTRRRRDLPFNWIFVLFAIFIFACGTTHILNIVVVWKPFYWLDGTVKALTAVVSVITAILLWPLIPKALRLPCPAQLSRAHMGMLEQAQQQTALAQLSQKAFFGLSEKGLLYEVANLALQQLGADEVQIFRWLDETSALQFVYGLTKEGRVSEHSEALSVASLAASARETVLIDDLSIESRVEPPPALLERGLKCAIATVVQGKVRPLGVIVVLSKESSHFGQKQTLFMEALSNLISFVLERRKAEEALHLSEERRRQLIESLREYAIFVLNPDGTVASWNTGAERIFGYRAEEIIGSNFSRFFKGKEVDENVPQAELLHALKEGHASSEGWRMRKDGTLFWASVVVTPLFDSEGKLTGYSKVTRDMTEKKLADDALLALTDKLKESNTQLEQFASVASHDLQEPLRKIQAFSERLREDYSDRLDGDGTKYLERMEHSATRMRLLIQDLLSYSRVTSETNAFLDVSLQEIASEVVLDLETQIRDLDAQVEVVSLPTLEADPAQMRQLLQNLVSNALKFHRSDVKPCVLIKGEPSESEGQISFSVADNGVGFDEKYKGRIFQLFQRLHSRSQFAGTGLGLAICKKIVDRHFGHIDVRSRVGEGSVFVITLPRKHIEDNQSNGK